MIFENQSIDEINRYIETSETDIDITLKGKYSGTLYIHNKHNISIHIQGEDACFSGTKTVCGQCEQYRDNIYKMPLAEKESIERLWINGQAFHMARYPNMAYDNKKQVYCSLSDAKYKLSQAKNPDSAFLRGLHSFEWGGNAYKIHKLADGSCDMEWVGNNNRGSQLHKDKVILENLFEELDAPCEFYYDRDNAVLYFYSETQPNGVIEIEYAVNQTLLEIIDSTCKISVSNLHFEKTDNSMYKGKWERYLRSDWAYNACACVKIDNSSNISFENCVFSQLGNNAVLIRNDSRNIRIENCDFRNCFSNGILILGDKDSTYCTSSWENDNHISYMESPDETGARSNRYPKSITIHDCLFEWLGLTDLQSAGVCISLAHKVTVSNSTFRHLPRAGINVAENAFGGHRIIHNDLWDCVRETGDHGLFNSWGRDRFWSLKRFNTTGKYGKMKKPYAFSDMLDRNQIVSNRVIGNGTFGIDLDDGSSGYDIKNNLCIGVSIKLREGFQRTVENNVIINAPFDYHCAYYKNDDVIRSNIVCYDIAIKNILINKGSNALFQNNYHISEMSADTSQFKSITSLTKENVLLGQYTLPDVKPISQVYGKNGVQPPTIDLNSKAHNTQKTVSLFCTISTVDDSIRTACAAPDYSGIFIEKISPLCRLYYKQGVRKGDLILEIDGQKPSLQNFKNMMKNAGCITVIRAQKVKKLE